MQEITPHQEMNFQREMQNEQIENSPNTIYADSLREEKVRNVIAQLNPELLLEEIEHRIRGEKRNYYTDEWESISKEGKIISEDLVQNYVSFLNAYLTQNNSLSNFSPDEINNIMHVIIEYIQNDLSDNAEKYGLTTKKVIKMPGFGNRLIRSITPEGYVSVRYEKIPIEIEIPVGEELTDYNEFNRIGHIVCQSTFAVLKQAQNGMLASRIFRALRVSETLNQGPQKSKLDFLKFW